MDKLTTTPKRPDAAETARRREALAYAERSNRREGLPPLSDFARAAADRFATGERTHDQVVAEILAHHRSKSG